MTLNSWFKQSLVPESVPESDCVRMFSDILKCPGKGRSGKKSLSDEVDIVEVSE